GGRIIGLREAGLSYRAVATRAAITAAQSCVFRSSGRTRVGQLRKSVSGRNVTPAREDRRLGCEDGSDGPHIFSRQLAAQWSTIATCFIASSLHQFGDVCSVGCAQGFPLCRIPLTQKPSPPATTLGQCA
ncbi:hypothetical protein TNCV_568371, partial [Trichonephila clavipes]